MNFNQTNLNVGDVNNVVHHPAHRPALQGPHMNRNVIEQMGWAESPAVLKDATLLRLFREVATYTPFLKSCVQFETGGDGQVSTLCDNNPAYHWSRIYEYPWCLAHCEAEPYHVALDCGGGPGPLQFALAKRCGVVVNCDPDPGVTNEVRQAQSDHSIAPNLKVVTSGLHDAHFPDGHFDRVLCVSVLEHLEDRQEFLRELLRVTAPGGLLLITMDVCFDYINNFEFPVTPSNVRDLLEILSSGAAYKPPDNDSTTATVKGHALRVLCLKVRKA